MSAEAQPHSSPDLYRIALVGWGVAGAVWVVWWGRFGLGMTADTMDYLGIGRRVFQLPPDVFQWPPAFWLSLQAARATGLAAWPAALTVLLLSRALLAAGAYRLGCRLAGRVAGHGLAAFTFVWVPLTYAGLYCLSETLFLAALVWWLGSAHGVRPGAPDLPQRVWQTTAWATLLVSTRFIGLPLVAVEWAFGTLVLRRAGVRGWRRTAAGTAACIVGPALLWAGLGQVLAGGAVGQRYPSRNPLGVHVSLLGTGWWDPILRGRYGDVFWGDQGGFSAPPQWTQAIFFLAVVALGWIAVQRRTGGAPQWRLRLGCGVAAYVVALVAVSTRVWLDPIGPRFMLPVVFLALAAACHPLRHLLRGAYLTQGLLLLIGAWVVDCLLAGSVSPRFGAPVLAVLGGGGAGLCLLAAYLDPRPPRTLRNVRPPLAVLLVCLLGTQGLWSRQLLGRVAAGRLPSIQHPGWRNEPGVRDALAAIAPGDTVYTHTGEAVRAVLDDRRDITIEPFCFRRLDPNCDVSLAEYVAALDGRARTATEWIVLCDRVSLPYLFADELHALALKRPHVEIRKAGSVSAYGWPPAP